MATATNTCFHKYPLGYCYICNSAQYQTSYNPVNPVYVTHHKTDHKPDKKILVVYDSDDDTVVGSVDSFSTRSSKKEAEKARRAYQKSLVDELHSEKERLKEAKRELDAYRQDVRNFEREVDSRERKIRNIERKMRHL